MTCEFPDVDNTTFRELKGRTEPFHHFGVTKLRYLRVRFKLVEIKGPHGLR